jgi:hypothetical protein
MRVRCHVPRLTGLSVTAARRRAASAGCRLRVKGSVVEEATIQTVARQSPDRNKRSATVTVWINPLCRREADYGPELKEPVLTPGPTKLVSGFFLVGGPLGRGFSTPGCKLPPPPPGSGSVDVLNASGAIVASETSAPGRFVEIPLAPGSYTVVGTFLNATINDVHPTATESVVIPSHDTVRQDFFLNIP